jgi:hypothetical protein
MLQVNAKIQNNMKRENKSIAKHKTFALFIKVKGVPKIHGLFIQCLSLEKQRFQYGLIKGLNGYKLK